MDIAASEWENWTSWHSFGRFGCLLTLTKTWINNISWSRFSHCLLLLLRLLHIMRPYTPQISASSFVSNILSGCLASLISALTYQSLLTSLIICFVFLLIRPLTCMATGVIMVSGISAGFVRIVKFSCCIKIRLTLLLLLWLFLCLTTCFIWLIGYLLCNFDLSEFLSIVSGPIRRISRRLMLWILKVCFSRLKSLHRLLWCNFWTSSIVC